MYYLKELLHANKSLPALQNVLFPLTPNKDHVAYHDSMLTQILLDSLGGDSKTLIIVNVSSNHIEVHKTISSLNYATRDQKVELRLRNYDP